MDIGHDQVFGPVHCVFQRPGDQDGSVGCDLDLVSFLIMLRT